MKEWIVEYTTDNGVTVSSKTVEAEDYTKAYLKVLYKLPDEGAIVSVKERN